MDRTNSSRVAFARSRSASWPMKMVPVHLLIVLVALTLTTGKRAPGQDTSALKDTARKTPAGISRSAYKESNPIDFNDHAGFVQIFDGKTLRDWDGDPSVWHIEDGCIVGLSTLQKPAGNTFLVYHGTQAHDFDLKLEIKVEFGGGSGVQYRSSLGLPPPGKDAGHQRTAQPRPTQKQWSMVGPQADFWYPVNPLDAGYSGQLYSQNTGRGILAQRGEVVESLPRKAPQRIANIGDRAALGSFVREGEWNQYTIVVRGGTFLHILNGQLMAVLVDDDPTSSNNKSGLFGLQIEGVPAKVSFRDIWLRKIN